MAGAVRFRVTKKFPPPAKVLVHLMNKAEDILTSVGIQSMQQRKKTTATWKGDAPDWHIKVERKLSQWVVNLKVHIDGPPLGQKKWWWITKGTKVRYAVMTKPFKAKTKFRVISSYVGKGHMRYIDPHIMRPGIRAREFDDEINERMEKKVDSRLDTELKRALKRKRFP